MHSLSQMTKQGFEAQAIGAKMVTIRRNILSWENLWKGFDRIKAQNPQKVQERDWTV